jgi:hypothetical protein
MINPLIIGSSSKDVHGRKHNGDVPLVRLLECCISRNIERNFDDYWYSKLRVGEAI